MLIVGERCHVPGMSAAHEARWEKLWRERPETCLQIPAFVRGFSRRNLEKILGPLGGHRLVNLLPPSAESGRWDGTLAERAAFHVRARARSGGGLVLLGRRVADAFRPGMGLCAVYSVEGIPTLVLPHPSGRSRVLNDPAARREAEGLARRYVERFSAAPA